MPGLELRLFGPIEVRVNGQPLPRLRSRKGLWLLALLALRAGRDVDRVWLAGTLWPDSDETHALRSLRQTLHDLRLALGSEACRLASEEPRTLRLDVDQASVDALDFDAAIAQGDTSSLESAVRIYNSPLLEGCAEEWSLEGRRQREQDYLRAVEELADHAIKRSEHTVAASYLRLAVAADPFREDLQRKLMDALAVDSPTGALLAYRQFRALLAREMMAEPAEETTALFRRIRDETRAQAKEPEESKVDQTTSAPPPSRTLPLQLTELIGRENDVDEVICRMSNSRLLTLTGAGGIGKTRLATQVAVELSSRYSLGAIFVALASLEDRSLLPEAVRAAVGGQAKGDLHDPIEILCQVISEIPMLIVLDNCEHLGEACGSLAASLLGRCEGLKILATSRQPLEVKGETVWRVPSLAVPKIGSRRVSAADIRHVGTFLDYSAIRLFAERARAAEATFEPTRKNSVSMVKICSLLDGIPLAIELAAARVRAMSVEKIAERLNDRFRILLGEKRSPNSAPVSRHATLIASIDWSYDLLSDRERILLRRLSVFSDGWTLEAAEAICAGEPIAGWEVLDLLTALVDKSLVVHQPNDDRYRLLETIRQYLLDRWDENRADAVMVSDKHMRYFVDLAEIADTELRGPRQAEWLNRFESDHDNLRSALSWSRSACGNAEAGVQMAGAIYLFWERRGFLREGREQLALALAAGSKELSMYRARAINRAGILAFRQSDYPAARLFYEEALAMWRELGDRYGTATTLNNLSVLTRQQSDLDAARAFNEESLAISREIGHRWLTALCLINLGPTIHDQGHSNEGRQMLEESLAITRDLGDSSLIAHSLHELGLIAFDMQDFTAARSFHEECIAIWRPMGAKLSVATNLSSLALCLHELGDRESSRSLQCESLTINRELGNLAGIASSLEAIARVALDDQSQSGHSDGSRNAALLLGAAEALREAIGSPLPRKKRDTQLRVVDRARKSLEGHSFDSAWADGRGMSPEQAVEYALSLKTSNAEAGADT